MSPKDFVRAPEGGCAILLGEDNRTVARVIGKILEKEGHRVHAVAAGPTALEALFERPFDLALLSANLPEMDAMEVTNLYRFGSVGRQRIPILGLIGEVSAQNSLGLAQGRTRRLYRQADRADRAPRSGQRLSRRGAMPQPLARTHRPWTPVQGAAIDMRVLRDLEKLGGEDFVENVVAQFIADASRLLPELSNLRRSRRHEPLPRSYPCLAQLRRQCRGGGAL